MNIIFQYLIYYFAGVLLDFLLTSNWRAVAKEKPITATIFSFATTVISTTVLYGIIATLDPSKSMIAIIIYSLGVASGTFLAMRLKVGTAD